MDKLRKGLYQVSEGLELIIALVAVIGVVIATLNLFPELLLYWQNRTDAEAFLIFLDAVFDVVIGLEFIKMLCKPSSQNIMEVLIFLIARHMIVQKTSALEDLLSVVSIGILFFFRRFMLATKPDKEQHVPELFGAIRNAGNKKVSSSNVCKKVTRILAQMTTAIKMSKSRLRGLLLSPIWRMLNTFFLHSPFLL